MPRVWALCVSGERVREMMGVRGAGVGVGVAALGAVILSALVLMMGRGGDRVPVMSLEVGECVALDLPFQSEDLNLVQRVPCDGEHSGEVLHTGELNPQGDRAYPTDDLGLFLEVLWACVRPPGPGQISVFERRTGEPYSSRSPEVVPVAPDLRTWDGAAGKFLCLMLTGPGSARV